MTTQKLNRRVHTLIDGMIRVPQGDLPAAARARLQQELSFPNPEYLQRTKYGRWTGDIPAEINLLEEKPAGWLQLPRGAGHILRKAVRLGGRELEVVDQRASFPPARQTCKLQLRHYQEQAVVALSKSIQGCLVAPCGAGKTVMGIGAVARLAQPTLVLVHTKDLLDQWHKAVAEALGLDAGVIADGLRNPSHITIATVQTLAGMDEPELDHLGRQFGVVIVDEAHHVPAVTFRSVLGHLPGKYRFGLTATPHRPDGLTPLLNLGIGPVVFRISHRELIRSGHLVVPKVVPVLTRVSPWAETHADLVAALTENPERNRLILSLAKREASRGRSVLILSGRVDHCAMLAAALQRMNVPAEKLTGSVPRGQRREILQRFREGQTMVVCATSLADEGLDVKRLERLILATPARAEGRTIQRLGRLMRPLDGKQTPVLYDLVDDHYLAAAQFRARREAYRKVLGGSALSRDVQGHQLLQSAAAVA